LISAIVPCNWFKPNRQSRSEDIGGDVKGMFEDNGQMPAPRPLSHDLPVDIVRHAQLRDIANRKEQWWAETE
jgi:hypothetical protein